MKTVLSLMTVMALTSGIAFVSVRASDKGGGLVTKPLTFSGSKLVMQTSRFGCDSSLKTPIYTPFNSTSSPLLGRKS